MKPLVVNITSKRSHLSALRTYEIECLSSGSRPEAVITWWKGTHQVKHMARNVSISPSRERERTFPRRVPANPLGTAAQPTWILSSS